MGTAAAAARRRRGCGRALEASHGHTRANAHRARATDERPVGGCAERCGVFACVAVADPCAAPVRVRAHQQAPEEGVARVRWLALRQLRAPAHRARLLDRGAEDREEGPQAAGCDVAEGGVELRASGWPPARPHFYP